MREFLHLSFNNSLDMPVCVAHRLAKGSFLEMVGQPPQTYCHNTSSDFILNRQCCLFSTKH